MTPSLDPTRQPTDKPLLAVLRGERRDPPPMWLMRQAGRYLPEYRALRAEKGGFLDLVYDPAAAAEVTLQPLRRFAFDGAILFSDILIVPYAIGQNLWFETGEGPRLAPKMVDAALDDLQPALERLLPIYETVRRVQGRARAPNDLPGLCRKPVDRRHLHDRRAGQPRAGRGAPTGLCRSGQDGRDPRCHRVGHGRLSVRTDRGWGRGGAIVRQLVGQPCAGPVRAVRDRPQRVDRRRTQKAPSGYADHRLPQGRRRQARRLCPRDRGRRDRARRDGRSSLGRPRASRRHAGPGQSRPAGLDGRRRTAARCHAPRA